MADVVPAARVTGPTDAEWVASVRAGRVQDFDHLVRRHLPALLGFVHYLRVPEAQQDDVMQEAFVRAFAHLDRYDPERPFVTWLLVIARNYYFNERRRTARDQARRAAEPMCIPDIAGVEAAAISRVAAAAILAELSDDARFLVELRVFRELSFAEIGELLGESEGTVRVRFHRLLGQLRHEQQREERNERHERQTGL